MAKRPAPISIDDPRLDAATRPAPRRAAVAAGPFAVTVTAGPDAGQRAVASGPRLVIGTHPSAHLVLTDPTVSRFHCELEATARGVLVRDLGSSNETLIDGLAVEVARLTRPATLELGKTRLSFTPGDVAAPRPTSSLRRFGGLVGGGPAMTTVYALCERAAASDLPVLIDGPTGAGKTAAAEAIHQHGPRRDGPFVVVDCGALPTTLIESELFGHVRGAFTGAVAARDGAFLSAQGGTLFLDEIGELPLELQPKLLSALERKQVRRLGADRSEPVDARIIAATNRTLRGEVNAVRFRADLYYRLAVFEITMPSLADRLEDLPVLTEQLLERMHPDEVAAAGFLRTPAFLAHLARHRWPGNVRELRNYIDRSVALGTPAPFGTDAGGVASLVDASRTLADARTTWTRVCERQYLDEVLRRHGGSVTAAARAAGVSRVHLHRLLARLGMVRGDGDP